MVTIKNVISGSAADISGIRRGDILVRVNGHDINDVLDYNFYLAESRVRLLIHRGPELFDVVIKKNENDDIGLEFETYLMDEKRSCRNNCIFCFINQLPKGMRETLYFKDDDSRMSFLMGNYITLTNMDDKDIKRIIDMHMSPMKISVHTTEPELREYMLCNRFAGKCFDIMKQFAKGKIQMHCQIVLCKGVNDGEHLDRTMKDLASLYPAVTSVSIVPAGLTKHREGLYILEPYTAEECKGIIEQVDAFAEKIKKKHNSRLFFVADEIYIKAGLPLPSKEYYEDYSQLDNGIGLITSMNDEFKSALRHVTGYDLQPRYISVATGVAAYGFISGLVKKLEKKCPNIHANVYEIKNDFFGENVTVAGLLTGKDVYHALRGNDLGEVLYLPVSMLDHAREKFLDDVTPGWLEQKLNVKIVFVSNDGYEFVDKLLSNEDKK